MILHCKQSCKARFKNYKDSDKICPKVSDIEPKGINWLWILNENQNQKNSQKSYIHSILNLFFIAPNGSKTDSDESGLRPF